MGTLTDHDDTGFRLTSLPHGVPDGMQTAIPLGRYELPRRSEEAHIYRMAHPKAQALIDHAQHAPLSSSKPVLDYEAYGTKVSVIEELERQTGVLMVHTFGFSRSALQKNIRRSPNGRQRYSLRSGRYRPPPQHARTRDSPAA
ncbi:MAG: hypothetical protein IPL72_07710 [Sulfuritalea sp.]|nr:hypothetical protein [Sulfuritalea sp.]